MKLSFIGLSGYGTKLNNPTDEIETSTVKEIKGEFSLIVVLTKNELFQDVFSPIDIVLPDKPFLKSYGH